MISMGFSWGLPLVGSDVANSYDKLYIFLVYLSIFFFILVVGGMIYFAFKYKASKGQKPTYITHNNFLEFIYVSIPTILLMGIFAWGYVVYRDMVSSPANSYEVRVIGKQWMWQFQYPNGASTINELYVPVGQPVKLVMTSEDVLHSMFIPNFRVKQDVVPGMYTSIWFEAKVPGKHHLFCTEYCGTSHSGMIGSVFVLTPEQWSQWQAGKKLANIPDAREVYSQMEVRESGVANAGLIKSGQSPQFKNLTLSEQGKNLFANKGCVSCHRDGKNDGPALAPALQGLYGNTVTLSDGSKVKVDDQYLRDSILNPNGKITQGYQPIMPTFKGILSETDLNAMISYIKEMPSDSLNDSKETRHE